MSGYTATTAKLIAAFAAVYFIWGSTYLAMRYAIQTLPGFLMAASRFLISGAVLFAWAWWRGARPYEEDPWRKAAITAFLLFLLGNGTVVLAVHWVPSGLTALLISTTPLWVVMVEWAMPGGRHPGGRLTTGILLSFLGILLLLGIGEMPRGTVDILGAGTLLLSSISWAAGSVYARKALLSPSPLMTSAMQMLCGGGMLLIAGILNSDFSRLNLDAVSWQSVVAFLYLTIFGSIIAFTAYSWLIKAASPSSAITSSYINPVVAVLLGWAIAGEAITYRMLWAMATIILGVIVITSAKQRTT